MQLLLDCGIIRLPVDLNTICFKLGVYLLSYDEGAELIERAHLFRTVRRTSGLAFYFKNEPVILFDELKEFPEVNFTVAHELGHIVLAHVTPKGATHDPHKAALEEKAADRFAVRLLAPACVLFELDVHTPEEIVKLCRIPEKEAECSARLSRQNVFLIDSIEWAVCRQFQPYIQQTRSTQKTKHQRGPPRPLLCVIGGKYNHMRIDNLPAQLRDTGLFCFWKYEERNGKKTKVPYNPRTGGKAQSTNPDTFTPLAAALAAPDRSRYDGLGVGVFGALGAIDIDHCISDAGELSALALDVLKTMEAYTEKSPSGHGLRILFTVPDGFQYDKARY